MINIIKKIDGELFSIQMKFTKKCYDYCVIKDTYRPITDILMENTPGFVEIYLEAETLKDII